MPLSLPTPEDFGARGDGTTDDHAALNTFFNHWAARSLREPVALALSPLVGRGVRDPRGAYRFTKPLVIDCGATGANFKLRLYGNGAELRYEGPPDEYAVQIGDHARGKLAIYCHISDLIIRTPSRFTARGGLRHDNGDFCLYENVQVNGRYNEASIYVRYANSLTFHNVSTSTAHMGSGVILDNETNVFHWHGGKVQQATTGIQHSGSVFSIQDIDLSIIRDWGIVSSGSRGRIACYFEQIGSGARGDTGGCVRLTGARNVVVAGSLNCSNGAVTDGTHAGHGVKCEADTADVLIEGRGKLAQRAFVDVTDGCRNVVVASPAACVLKGPPEDFDAAQPCPFDDGVTFRNTGAIYLRDAAHPTVPPSLVPDDLSAWTARNRAGVIGGAAPDHRGDGAAQVVTLPQSSPPSNLRYSGVPAVAGTVLRLEMRARLVRFLEPVIARRSVDLAAVRMRIAHSPGESVEKHVRLGPGWQDYHVELSSPSSSGSLTFMLMLLTGWDPIEYAVDFVRVVKIGPP